MTLNPTVLLQRLRDSSKLKLDEPKCMNIGDQVRLRLKPSKLEKAKQYYSNDVYSISKVNKGSQQKLTTYKIVCTTSTSRSFGLLGISKTHCSLGISSI
jgi:hypothetical protein